MTSADGSAKVRCVSPEALVKAMDGGKPPMPVVLIVGEEHVRVELALSAMTRASLAVDPARMNHDRFIAGEARIDTVLGAAQSLPMMAPWRLVVVRHAERWERGGADSGEGEAEAELATGVSDAPLDRLAAYAKSPNPSTLLVIVATKLHGQRRLVTLAKKEGFFVDAGPFSRDELIQELQRAATARGTKLASAEASHLVELLGTDLAIQFDALERLSLYVGAGQPITAQAIQEVVSPISQATVWQVVDAISQRRTGDALALLSSVYDPRDGGLRVLGGIAFGVRQLAKLQAALASGMNEASAAKAAGLPPFRVREGMASLKCVGAAAPQRWLGLLAQADRALKSSRRKPDRILDELLVAMAAS